MNKNSITSLARACAIALVSSVLAAEPAIAAEDVNKYLKVVPAAPGNPPTTTGTGVVALGYDTIAGNEAIAIGQQAWALDAGKSSQGQGVAVGARTRVRGSGVALGGSAEAEESGVSVGRGARTNRGGVAIGAGAFATENGIAIGQGSAAHESGTVSFGDAYGSLRRRLVNLADGINADDAVTMRQHSGLVARHEALDGLAVKYTDLSRQTVILGDVASGRVRLTNVADAVEESDAVNKRQLDNIAGRVGGIANDALMFDGQAYNASRGNQPTRLSGVAAGTQGNDAANFDQVQAVSAAFGGGIGWSNGAMTSPAYQVAGGSFGTVGDALAALNGKLASLETSVDIATQTTTGAVRYDGSRRDAVTLEGVAGTRVANVKAGVDALDAVNVSQLRQAAVDGRAYTDQRADTSLRDAKTYTDSRVADVWKTLDDRDARIDARLRQQDKRVDRQAAMTSAMVQMAINTGGSRSPNGRIGAGIGWSGGQRALSVGWSKSVGRASFSFGGAFSGSESSAGVGFGMDL